MRWVLVCFAVLSLALPARAQNPTPYSGTRVIETNQPFDGFVSKLLSAIKANKMGIVAQACANCGAKSIGETHRNPSKVWPPGRFRRTLPFNDQIA